MFSADAVALAYLKDGHCERRYLEGVLHELESFYARSVAPPDIDIYIHGPVEGPPTECDSQRTIVLSLSEEKRLVPTYFARVRLLFKQHAPYFRLTRFGLVGFRPSNLYPLPLGYDSNVPYFPPKPAAQRTIDVFFSGSNWKSRRRFFRAAQRMAADSGWKVELTATDSFHAGLSPQEYGKKLANTKIALSPKGFVSTESFRLYEAMRAGCIVVTVRQPRSWYRDGWPVVEIRRWSKLRRVVGRILRDEEELSRRQAETIRWWNEKLSERAVAEFIGNQSLRPRPARGLLAFEGVLAAIIDLLVRIEVQAVRLLKARLRGAGEVAS